MKKIKKVLSRILGDKLFSYVMGKKVRMYEFINKRKLLNQRNFFYSSFVKENDLCFDVGANIGNRTESMLAIGAKVVAVEPQKACVYALEKKFGDAITIVPKGLGSQDGYLDMFIATNSTISSFSKEWISKVKQDRFSEYNWKQSEKIEITTLDKLIEAYGVPVFLKIDVEGFEHEVLKGLSRAIRYVSIEYNVPDNSENAILCLRRLQELDASAKCNYSVGESMEWELGQWIPIKEMIDHIESEVFKKTSFGDIYIESGSY